jgi:hypothetical protein
MTHKHDIMNLDDDQFPCSSFNGIELTFEQMTTLFRKWKECQCDMTWSQFSNSVQGTIGCNGAVAVYWCNMWLCIEPDGYCHT